MKHIPDTLDERLEEYRLHPNPTSIELNALLGQYRLLARKHWPKAEWIVGVGRYALIAQCIGVTGSGFGYSSSPVTVSIHMTMAEARKAKAFIDNHGCCGKCLALDGYAKVVHVIFDLHETYLYPDSLKEVE